LAFKYPTQYKEFRSKLAKERVAGGLTQVELAERLGRSQAQISSVESGDKQIDVLEYLRWMQAVGASEEQSLAYIQELDKALRSTAALSLGPTRRRVRLKPL
jgi:transcriptional regulator with XRE-family HTH domain